MRLMRKEFRFVLEYHHVITIALVGSLIFLSLPGFNDLLYIQKRTNISGVSSNEWVWIAVSTAWIILVFQLSPRVLQRMIKENTAFLFFSVANLLWMVVPLYQSSREDADATGFSMHKTVELIGGKAAWPALWNIAILCIPVQRVSPILEAIGISSKQAVPFHIWAAKAAMLWLLLHTILLSLVYAWRTESLSGWLALMLPYKMYYTEGAVNFMGWLGLVFFIGIWATSLPLVQRKFYEAFRILHWIFSAAFLLASNLHDYNTWFFIQPAIVMLVADFVLRRNSNLTFEESIDEDVSNINRQEGKVNFSATGEMASLTFPIPKSWPQLEPGMHVFLTVENISRWQSHPFSISKINQQEGTFSIHVKALGGWTTDFVSAVHDACNSPLGGGLSSWKIEGPYGSSALYKTIQSHKYCIFVAGGVGITGVSALAKARCHRTRGTAIGEDECQETECGEDKRTAMFWMVRTKAEAKFLVPLLHDCNNNINAHVWITQEENSAAIGQESEEDGNTILPPTASLNARWGLGFRWQKRVVLFASILSSVVIILVSRFICANQPGRIPHSHECSFLWHVSTCSSCEIEDTWSDNNDNQIPCCTVPVCQLCFRGVPMILSFLLMPPLTVLLARLLGALRLRSCRRSFLGYAFVNNRDAESHSASGSLEMEPSVLEGIWREATSDAGPTEVGSGKIEFHWGKRPDGNISNLFSGRYLPPGLVFGGIANPEDVIVVVCGPPSLVETTKQELAKDPFRRHWRVVLAS